jgi:hypothetical protein
METKVIYPTKQEITELELLKKQAKAFEEFAIEIRDWYTANLLGNELLAPSFVVVIKRLTSKLEELRVLEHNSLVVQSKGCLIIGCSIEERS